MSGGHTPAPWTAEVYDDLDHAKEFSGGFEWARAESWPKDERPATVWRVVKPGPDGPKTGTTGLPGSIETTEANARLIAAAPDLLDAAQLFVRSVGVAPDEVIAGAFGADTLKALNKARNAIAKAEGR